VDRIGPDVGVQSGPGNRSHSGHIVLDLEAMTRSGFQPTDDYSRLAAADR